MATILAAGSCLLSASQPGNSTYSSATAATGFPVSPNILADGGFESSMGPWRLAVTNDGKIAGTAAVDSSAVFDGNAAAHVVVTSPGTSVWHLSFEQDKLSLIGGKSYVVQFRARAGSPRSIGVATQGLSAPYPNYGLDATVNLTTAWTLYSLTFVATSTVTDGRLEFLVANAASNIWLDDVQLFTAGAFSQTITFTNPGTHSRSASPVTLTGTVSSGMAISYGSNSHSVCTVWQNLVTLYGPGQCSITATQWGTSGFLAAPPVTQIFTVTN
jgi:hypothetical protein